MIILYLQLISNIFAVKIENGKLGFQEVRNLNVNPAFYPIEKIKLSVGGILKEFPDLKVKEDNEIREEGIKRFKERLKSFNNEIDMANYVAEDLNKHGYELKAYQRKGFRMIKAKNGRIIR